MKRDLWRIVVDGIECDKNRGTYKTGHAGPRAMIEGFAGCFHGQIDVFFVTGGHRRDNLPGSRIYRLESFSCSLFCKLRSQQLLIVFQFNTIVIPFLNRQNLMNSKLKSGKREFSEGRDVPETESTNCPLMKSFVNLILGMWTS